MISRKFLLLHKVCTSGLTGVVFWPNRVQSPSCRRNRCVGPRAPPDFSRQVVAQIMRGFYVFFTKVHSTLLHLQTVIGFGSCLARNQWQRHGVFGVVGTSHEGKKARAAVRWFPGGGWATRTPRVRRPRRSCPRPCSPSRPSIEPSAKRPAGTTASPSGATFWLRMTVLLVRSAPTRWRRASAQGCLPPVRNGSNYKVQAVPRSLASTSTIAPGRTRARSDDRTRAESGRAARIVRCSTGSGSGTASQTLGRKLVTCRCRRAARGRRDRFGSARTTRTRTEAVVRRESRNAALDTGRVRHHKRWAGRSPRAAAVARPAASATASGTTRVSRAAEN